MPTTNYHTVNGKMIGQTTSGARTDYLTDALGSVTGTVNSAGSFVNTYRYKPYGNPLSSSGGGTTPRFRWTGNTGSRRTDVNLYSENYNRARHYGAIQGQWTTVDPLWPSELAYAYSYQNPTSLTDPSGNSSLTYETLYKSNTCDCPQDDVHWKIRWKLPQRPVNGFIIQRIHIVGKLYSPCNWMVPIEWSSGPFWEAWQVASGKIWHGYARHGRNPGVDSWGIDPNRDLTCMRATITTMGEAVFVPGITLKWSERDGPNGPLPFTSVEPGFWKKHSGRALKRSFTIKFVCCCYPPACKSASNSCLVT